MIRIVTDSTCDLPPDLIQAYGITVVPLYLNFGTQGFLDGVEMTREEFYRRLPESEPLPTTAAPGTEMFRKVYDSLAAEGAQEVLSIHIARSLSATVDVVRLAAQGTRSVKVTVLDSGQLSLGMGFQVVTAAKAAAAGATMAEILAAVDDQAKRTHVFAALDTLEFLRRSGRMNGIVAGLGGLLQIKPLLKMYAGTATSERVRTTNGATSRLLSLLEERAPFEQVALVHTHAADKALTVAEQAASLLPPGELLSTDITPVIGAHIGPGAVGFACVTEAGMGTAEG
jgi:DegV family protein with EDD domain